jgi:hypothetical protein
MKKDLIALVGTSTEAATVLAIQHGCVGFYMGVPPVMSGQAEAEGWVLPCVVTENEDGVVVAWEAV